LKGRFLFKDRDKGAAGYRQAQWFKQPHTAPLIHRSRLQECGSSNPSAAIIALLPRFRQVAAIRGPPGT